MVSTSAITSPSRPQTRQGSLTSLGKRGVIRFWTPLLSLASPTSHALILASASKSGELRHNTFCNFHFSLSSAQTICNHIQLLFSQLVMAPLIPSAKATLSYPLYAVDFDPLDSTRLLVGGGGGAGRTGVGNKIVSQALYMRPDSAEQILNVPSRLFSTRRTPTSFRNCATSNLVKTKTT